MSCTCNKNVIKIKANNKQSGVLDHEQAFLSTSSEFLTIISSPVPHVSAYSLDLIKS